MESRKTRRPGTATRRGVVLPIVILLVIVVGILLVAVFQYSMQETRTLDFVFHKKMAFNAAETGLETCAARLISRPFFERWYLKELVAANGSLEARLKAIASPHFYPKDAGGVVYMRNGAYRVCLVENAVKQPTVLTPDVWKGKEEDPQVKDDMYLMARLSHVDMYSIGTWKNPATGKLNRCLYYGKFVILPEPLLYEYDTNGDGKISYIGARTGEEAEPEKEFFSNHNDLIGHPFASKDLWKTYIPEDTAHNMQNTSPAPLMARVIKRVAFHEWIRFRHADGTEERYAIADLDLSKLEDRKKVLLALAHRNVNFLKNFAANQAVMNRFSDEDASMAPGLAKASTVTQAQIEQLVQAAGGVGDRPDFPASDGGPAFVQSKNRFMSTMLKSFRMREGKPYDQHEFILGANPRPPEAKARFLGEVFQIPSGNFDNKAFDALKSGKVKTGEQLLDVLAVPESRKPQDFARDVSEAVQNFAVVQYPKGRVLKTKQDEDKVHTARRGFKRDADGQIIGGGEFIYSLNDDFERALDGDPPGGGQSPSQFYASLQTAKSEADAVDCKATLSTPGKLDMGKNQIPIVLVDRKNLELTTSFDNVVDYYYKFVDHDYQGHPEDNADFDFEMPHLKPQTTAIWDWICYGSHKKIARINEAGMNNTGHAMAIGP